MYRFAGRRTSGLARPSVFTINNWDHKGNRWNGLQTPTIGPVSAAGLFRAFVNAGHELLRHGDFSALPDNRATLTITTASSSKTIF